MQVSPSPTTSGVGVVAGTSGVGVVMGTSGVGVVMGTSGMGVVMGTSVNCCVMCCTVVMELAGQAHSCASTRNWSA